MITRGGKDETKLVRGDNAGFEDRYRKDGGIFVLLIIFSVVPQNLGRLCLHDESNLVEESSKTMQRLCNYCDHKSNNDFRKIIQLYAPKEICWSDLEELFLARNLKVARDSVCEA